MGAASSTGRVDLGLLTTVHLPQSCSIALQDEDGCSLHAVVAGCTEPGLLLCGDVLVFVQGMRVQGCAHARSLLAPASRLKAAAIPNMPSDVLRVLVKRAHKTEVALERPAAANGAEVPRFGLHVASGMNVSMPGVQVVAIDCEGPAADLASSGALVLGCEITHVDGEEVCSANSVSRLLRSVASGNRATLTCRHMPRSRAFEPLVSVPRLTPASGGGKQSGTHALATARIDELSPHPSPTGTTNTLASTEDVEMLFV
jgi:hypothetical protein